MYTTPLHKLYLLIIDKLTNVLFYNYIIIPLCI